MARNYVGATRRAAADLRLPETLDQARAIAGDKDAIAAWKAAGRLGELHDHVQTLKAEAAEADKIDAIRNDGNPTRKIDVAPGPARWDQAATDDTGHPLPQGVPALAPSTDTITSLYRAVVDQSTARIVNAVITTGDTGAGDHSVPLVGRLREPRRIVTAAGIMAQPVDGITSVDYPVFGSDEAGITAEGASKTEYDSITPGSATPQMITLFSDYTRQQLLTQPGFEAKLRSVLASRVAVREDLLVTQTVLGTTGIQVIDNEGTIGIDQLLHGAALVAAGDVAQEPTVALVNPADVSTLLGTTVGPGATATGVPTEFLPRVHGMLLYPTSAIPATEALVGAWAAASTFVVGLPPTYLVDATSGIKTNVVTTLLEEAVTLAVDEPTGFVHIHNPA